MFSGIQNWDFGVLNFIQSHFRNDFFDFFFSRFTHIADHGIIWIIAAIIFMFLKNYRKCGVTVLCGIVIEYSISDLLIKRLVKRQRPCWINTDIDLLIPTPHDYSFPSGHTFISFTVATIIFSYNKYFGIIAYVVAALLAYSRLYLYVHFPSDVIGGMVFGIVLGGLIGYLSQKVSLPKKNKAE